MNRSTTYELSAAKKLLFICSFFCAFCFAQGQPYTPPTVYTNTLQSSFNYGSNANSNSTANKSDAPCTPTVTIVKKDVCQNDSIHLLFTGTAPFKLDYSLNGARRKITVFGTDTAFVATQAGGNVLIVYDLVDGNNCFDGVEINGLVWAKYNVDAPGTFTENPEDAGMFYQWSSSIGWTTTDPIDCISAGGCVWNSNWGDIWKPTSFAICPESWRVPTNDELQTLVDAGSQWTTVNGVTGRMFGSGNNTIFLPAAGERNPHYRGQIHGAGTDGFYWSSDGGEGHICTIGHEWITTFCSSKSKALSFSDTLVDMERFTFSSEGLSVRCVKEKEIITDTITLTVHSPKTKTITATICSNDIYRFNGKYYNETGTYTATLQTSFGCDSIVTLNLTVDESCVSCTPPTVTIVEKNVCLNDAIHLQFTGIAPFQLDYEFNGVRQKITIWGMDTTLAATQSGKNVFIVYNLVDGEGCSFGNSDTDDGVEINGLVWAKYNVDAPNTFTQNPEDTGMFYQFNSPVGWSATDPMVSTDGSTWSSCREENNATTWENANNVCPENWRVPTNDELQSLVDAGSQWTTVNGVTGRMFGSGDNTIFLPVVGMRDPTLQGAIYNVGFGYYWSSVGENQVMCIGFPPPPDPRPPHWRMGVCCSQSETLYFNDEYHHVTKYAFASEGHNVRCVKEKNSIADTITIIVAVHPTKTDTLHISICENEKYFFNGNYYNTTGLFTATLQSSFGCDSTVTLNLTVLVPDTTRINATIFVGEGYNRHGFTIPIQTEAGTLHDTLRLKSKYLCDSVVILTLKIDTICTPPTVTILEKDVCQNDNIHLVFTGTAPFELDYSLNGVRRKITVFGMDTAFVATQVGKNVFIFHDLIDGNGCSSNDTKDGVEINGIIWAKYNVDAPGTFAANPEDAGLFYQWNTTRGWSSTNPAISTDGSAWRDEWDWNWSANDATTWETTNNICPEGWRIPTHSEQVSLVGAGSIWQTQNGKRGLLFGSGNNTIFLPNCYFRFGSNNLTGDSYYDATRYWSSTRVSGSSASYRLGFGINTQEVSLYSGTWHYSALPVRCVKDIKKDTITVHPTKEETITATICSNETYLFNGNNYNETGIYTDTLKTSFGCDSIVTLTLTVNPAFDEQENITICDSELPFTFRDVVFGTETVSGQYIFNRKTVNGCDSITTLTLTVNPTFDLQETIILCDDIFPFTFRDITFETGTAEGTYVFNRTTVTGCDSTVTLNLTYNTNFTEQITLCDSELPFTFRDITFGTGTVSGDYVFNRTSLYGCDSIVTLSLTVNESFTVFDTIVLYDNDLPFTYLNMTFSHGSYSGDYVFPRKTVSGCDSIIHLNLTIHQILRQTICESELPTLIRDTWFPQGTPSDVYMVDKGLTTLILTVNPTPQFTISNTDIIACTNSNYVEIVAGNFAPPFNANASLQWTILYENGDRYIIPDNSGQILLADTVLFPDVGKYRIEVVYQYQSNGRVCNSSTTVIDYAVFEPPHSPIVATQKTMCEGELSPLQAFGSPLIQWISSDKKLHNWVGETYNFEKLGLSDIPVGTYEFELFDIDAVSGCKSERVQTSFEVTPAANPKIMGRNQFCLQSIEEQYEIKTVAQGSEYFWKTSGNQYNYSKDGNPYSPNRYVDWYGVGIDTLSVYERTYAGCEGYDTLVVFIADYPVPFYTWSLPSASTIIEFTDSSYQAPIVATQPDGTQVEIPLTYTMEWFFDTNDNRDTSVVDMFVEYHNRFNPIQIENYTYGFKYPILTVTNNYGCHASYVTEIFVDIPNGIYIPNAFSPANAAASVRVFKPVAYNLEYCKVWIYDKWGNLLWYSNEVQNGTFTGAWDGVYNGELLQSDVYIWKIEAKFLNGTTWAGQKKMLGGYSNFGSVVLIR
ncbi:MAG: hypothetical protein FWC39_10145 [Bacteroidetes bacterium]|nr:hypothetical protein [Bacteroidota bacterium]